MRIFWTWLAAGIIVVILTWKPYVDPADAETGDPQWHTLSVEPCGNPVDWPRLMTGYLPYTTVWPSSTGFREEFSQALSRLVEPHIDPKVVEAIANAQEGFITGIFSQDEKDFVAFIIKVNDCDVYKIIMPLEIYQTALAIMGKRLSLDTGRHYALPTSEA